MSSYVKISCGNIGVGGKTNLDIAKHLMCMSDLVEVCRLALDSDMSAEKSVSNVLYFYVEEQLKQMAGEIRS